MFSRIWKRVEDVEDGLIDSPKAPLEQDYLTYK